MKRVICSHGIRPATQAWWALLALSAASIQVAGFGHQVQERSWMALAVAALCALKAELVIRYYLEARQAGPVFQGLVRLFALLAPVLLAVSAIRESLLG
jgi:hypothetical protein